MPAGFIKEYASFASDIDLQAEVASRDNTIGAVSRVQVVDAGSGGLAVRNFNGETITLTSVIAGDLDLVPTTILASGTSVAKLRIWWRTR